MLAMVFGISRIGVLMSFGMEGFGGVGLRRKRVLGAAGLGNGQGLNLHGGDRLEVGLGNAGGCWFPSL